MTIKTPDRVELMERVDEDGHSVAAILLHEAVSSGSREMFVDAVESIDWASQSPALAKQAVDLALEVGCHLVAAQLAAKGHELFPDDPALERIAHVLAPPKLVRTGLPPVPGLGASMQWLREHQGDYGGKWVVIRNGELLAASDSREELSNELDGLDSLTEILVAKLS
ncbi:MAG: hypothetical protein MAG451_02975 [Anaerolineales bacterium]|nr:hypothetical protein [Anaerolineales bacterium]